MCRLADNVTLCKASVMAEMKRKPGDIILDHYMPNAAPEDREEARANLRALGHIIIAIQERLERERLDSRKNEP